MIEECIILILVIAVAILLILNDSHRTQLPYHKNIELETEKNSEFRHIDYTTDTLQVVLMSLKPGEEIGSEIHPHITQFFRVESGNGYANINDIRYDLSPGFSVVVPPGSKHNIVNNGSSDLKLYTIYGPPAH